MSAEQGTGLCNLADMQDALWEVRRVFPLEDIRPTGSTYMLGEGQDCDVLVAVLNLAVASRRATEAGFELCANTQYGDDCNASWRAFRLGNVNLIVVADPELFKRWLAAAEVCRILQVKDKRWRAALHEIIKNNRTAEEAQTWLINP